MRKGERNNNTVKTICLPQVFSESALKSDLEKAHITFIKCELEKLEYSNIEHDYVKNKMIEKL